MEFIYSGKLSALGQIVRLRLAAQSCARPSALRNAARRSTGRHCTSLRAARPRSPPQGATQLRHGTALRLARQDIAKAAEPPGPQRLPIPIRPIPTRRAELDFVLRAQIKFADRLLVVRPHIVRTVHPTLRVTPLGLMLDRSNKVKAEPNHQRRASVPLLLPSPAYR